MNTMPDMAAFELLCRVAQGMQPSEMREDVIEVCVDMVIENIRKDHPEEADKPDSRAYARLGVLMPADALLEVADILGTIK